MGGCGQQLHHGHYRLHALRYADKSAYHAADGFPRVLVTLQCARDALHAVAYALYAAPRVLYRAHCFGEAFRVHLYLYRLQSCPQTFQFLVQLVYLPQCFVLAYQPYVEVFLYAARPLLGVAVALPFVRRASLHNVGRLRLGFNG